MRCSQCPKRRRCSQNRREEARPFQTPWLTLLTTIDPDALRSMPQITPMVTALSMNVGTCARGGLYPVGNRTADQCQSAKATLLRISVATRAAPAATQRCPQPAPEESLFGNHRDRYRRARNNEQASSTCSFYGAARAAGLSAPAEGRKAGEQRHHDNRKDDGDRITLHDARTSPREADFARRETLQVPKNG